MGWGLRGIKIFFYWVGRETVRFCSLSFSVCVCGDGIGRCLVEKEEALLYWYSWCQQTRVIAGS